MQRIIFFDGICPLCNGFVSHVFKYDKNRLFKFAPLQSNTARTLLTGPDLGLDSVVYLENGTVFRKSAAVARIMFHLQGVHYFAALLLLVFPAFIRDFFYDVIAKNRYSIFGKMDVCRLPGPGEKAFFLD